MTNARAPHETLGISENAAGAEIEEAYHRKKLYLNPANFEEGSKEREEINAHILELGEARAKMLAAAAPPIRPAAPPVKPPAPVSDEERREEARLAEPDYPILDPASETRKKMFRSVAVTIGLSFLVMLFVSLSFAYTSGLKADIAALSARINLLEAEKNNLKDKIDSLAGKLNGLGDNISNLNNTALDMNSRIIALEYRR